jgi:hypothetical protein
MESRSTDRSDSFSGFSSSAVQIGQRMEMKYAKGAQKPQHYGDNDYTIEDGLNIRLHGNKSVHEPQQESHDDKRNNDVNQHRFSPCYGAEKSGPSMDPD